MPKIPIDPLVGDPIAQTNFEALHNLVNGNIGIDNFKYQVIEGTTSNTPDEQLLVQHSMRPQPSFVLPFVGDVYIQNITDTFVDVRSTKASVQFKIICFAGPKIIDETVTNPDDFLDTVGVIERESPSFSIDVGYIPNQPLPNQILQIIADANYFYATVASNDALYRIEKATGLVSRLDLAFTSDARPGPICFDDASPTTLYAAAHNATGGPTTTANEIAIVDLTTFTVSSYLTMPIDYINAGKILAKGDRVYLSAYSTVTISRPRFMSVLKSGGSGQQVTLGGAASTTAAAYDFIWNGTNFYVLASTLTNSVFEVAEGGGGALTATQFTLSDGTARRFYRVLNYNGRILLLYSTNASSSSTTVYEAPVVVEFFPAGASFTEIVQLPVLYELNTNQFLVDAGGTIYYASGSLNVTTLEIGRYNIEAGTITSNVFLFPMTAQVLSTASGGTGIFPSGKDNVINFDSDGVLAGFSSFGTSVAIQNFNYFYPELP